MILGISILEIFLCTEEISFFCLTLTRNVVEKPFRV